MPANRCRKHHLAMADMNLLVLTDVTSSIVGDPGQASRRPGVVSFTHLERGRGTSWLLHSQVPPGPGGTGPTALAVARLPSSPRAAYSPCVGLRDLAIGVRGAGGVRGVRDGPAREWCRRAVVTHRVVAWVAASAALYACALTVASTRQRDALSPAGLTIATLVYVSFAVILIVRWPPWLLAAVTTAGAVASMAAGTPDLLVGPALVVGMFVFSLRSERTPAIGGPRPSSAPCSPVTWCSACTRRRAGPISGWCPGPRWRPPSGRRSGPSGRIRPCSRSGPGARRKAGNTKHAAGCSRSGCGSPVSCTTRWATKSR